MTRRQLTWLLTLALAALLLLLAFRGVDWAELFAAFGRVALPNLLLVLALVALNAVLRALRWRVLLTAQADLSPLDAFWGTTAGYMGNFLLPARAGELIRSALIAGRTGLNVAYVLATALTERIFDAAVLVIIALVTLSALPAMPAWILDAARGIAPLGVLGFGILLIAPRLRGLFTKVIQRLPLPGTLRARLLDLMQQFMQGAQAFQHVGRALTFAAFTVAVWSLDAVIALTAARSLGMALQPTEAFLLLAGLGLGSALPSTPGYVGIYQFVTVSLLVPLGYPQSGALALILFTQGMNYVVMVSCGLVGVWQLNAGRGLRDVLQSTEANPKQI